MPGRKKHRPPEPPRTVSVNGGLHKVPARLTHAEIAILARFLDCARIAKVVPKRNPRWRPVPPQLWEPIAQAIAQAHGITARQMLYQGNGYRFVIPRARFWRTLRAFTRDGETPRYSLKAIAAITGHDHTTVLHALRAGTAEMDYGKVMQRAQRYERAEAVKHLRATAPEAAPPNKRRDHTGQVYGSMTVLGPAAPPAGRKGRWWRCSCSCGSVSVQFTHSLVQGKGACGVDGHRAKSLNTVHNRLIHQHERPTA